MTNWAAEARRVARRREKPTLHMDFALCVTVDHAIAIGAERRNVPTYSTMLSTTSADKNSDTIAYVKSVNSVFVRVATITCIQACSIHRVQAASTHGKAVYFQPQQ